MQNLYSLTFSTLIFVTIEKKVATFCFFYRNNYNQYQYYSHDRVTKCEKRMMKGKKGKGRERGSRDRKRWDIIYFFLLTKNL